jgi:hypothetical protein
MLVVSINAPKNCSLCWRSERCPFPQETEEETRRVDLVSDPKHVKEQSYLRHHGRDVHRKHTLQMAFQWQLNATEHMHHRNCK